MLLGAEVVKGVEQSSAVARAWWWPPKCPLLIPDFSVWQPWSTYRTRSWWVVEWLVLLISSSFTATTTAECWWWRVWEDDTAAVGVGTGGGCDASILEMGLLSQFFCSTTSFLGPPRAAIIKKKNQCCC